MKRKYEKSEYIYKGRKISLRLDSYKINGKHYTAEIVEHRGAIVILPIDNDEVIFIRQYRYPLKDYILELPAGTLEPGEEPEKTAQRELIEETGYKSHKLELLGSFYASPGYTTEILYAFLATNLEKTTPKPEEYEEIKILRVNLDEVPLIIARNEIRDAKTLATFMLYYAKIARNKF